MPEGPTDPNLITVAELQNELRGISDWIEGVRKVAAAVEPPSSVLSRSIEWEPGGIKPPPRITRCGPPPPTWRLEVTAADVVGVLAALRDWTTSVVTALDGLPGGLEMPIPPGDDSSE